MGTAFYIILQGKFMYKNSAFAPTETFVMLLTAFLKNSESDFLIVVPNDIQVSSPVDSYVKSVGGQVVTIVEAKKLEKKGFPEHIWVHSRRFSTQLSK